MVKIRLARFGAKKKPYYRIVVTNSRHPRDGRVSEQIGTYNPLTTPATVRFNKDKLASWLQKGAQPTRTVANLIRLQAKSGAEITHKPEDTKNP